MIDYSKTAIRDVTFIEAQCTTSSVVFVIGRYQEL